MIDTLTRQLEGLPSVETIQTSLTEHLRSGLKIQAAALWLLDHHTDELLLRATSGLAADHTEQLPAGFDPGWFNDAAHSCVGNVILFHEINRMAATDWHIALQLRSGETLQGILLLGAKANHRPYSSKEIEAFDTIAYWVGSSLYTRQLVKQNLEREYHIAALILDHEEALRQEMVANLHDEGLTRLSHIKNELGAQDADPDTINRLQDIIDHIRDVARKDMMPFQPLKGLIEAFESYCIESRVRRQVAITTIYNSDSKPQWRQLDDRIKRAVYYTAREAVENALKADPAASIKVIFEIQPHLYRVVINDQGPGFDTNLLHTPDQAHYGLTIMSTRMRSIEGQVDVQSTIGVGTTVTLTGPTGLSRDRHPLSAKPI